MTLPELVAHGAETEKKASAIVAQLQGDGVKTASDREKLGEELQVLLTETLVAKKASAVAAIMGLEGDMTDVIKTTAEMSVAEIVDELGITAA